MQVLKRVIAAAALALGLAATDAAAQQTLKVGLIPSEDSRAMLTQSKEILEALEKKLGMKVQGFVATDYNGVIEALLTTLGVSPCATDHGIEAADWSRLIDDALAGERGKNFIGRRESLVAELAA